jgi:transcriptional regulator with XRE-family HTH domain
MANLRQRFGKAVRKLREPTGHSQEVFAVMIKVNRTYYSRIERGIANPSLEVIGRIAAALKVPLEELFAAVGRE